MTQTYGPFFSGAGDAFNETQWREFFGNFFSSGVFKGGKVNGTAGNDLQVTAPGSGMTVAVGTGLANAYGFFYENDASLSITLATSDPSLDRIDYIVCKLDFAGRSVQSVAVTGTPASTPAAPTLTQTSSTWMIPLATVYVTHGTSTIVSGNVTDQRVYIGTVAPTLQGSGSGLNADKLDNLDSTVFVLGSGSSQHIIVLNRVPTNSDGVDGDLIFQW